MKMHDEGFEVPNSGVAELEPEEEAGPDVMGKIITKFSHVKEKVKKQGGSTSPGNVQAGEIQSQDWRISHRQELFIRSLAADRSLIGGSARFSEAGGSRRSLESISLRSDPGVGGRSLNARSVHSEGSQYGSARSVQSEGAIKAPNKVSNRTSGYLSHWGERIMDLLPITVDPYAVGDGTTTFQPPEMVPEANPFPRTTGVNEWHRPHIRSMLGRLKLMMTGEKPKQESSTETTMTGSPRSLREQKPLMEDDGPSPTPEKLRRTGLSDVAEEIWAATPHPEANGTDADGQEMEEVMEPKPEDKKQGAVIRNLMDEFQFIETPTTNPDTSTGLKEE